MAFQVHHFSTLDFDDSWKQKPTAAPCCGFQYTATTEGARMAVVMELPTGQDMTINYVLPKNAAVFVLDQVVHIPARCTKRDRGNTVKCKE